MPGAHPLTVRQTAAANARDEAGRSSKGWLAITEEKDDKKLATPFR
ncbi:hypothetical protein VSR68_38080 [Paraburkholderia phymatum]